MNHIRVVLDTNVVVSALLFAGLPRSVLQSAILGQVRAVTSAVLLAELNEVLVKKFSYSATQAVATTEKYARITETVTPAETVAVLKDIPDNRVLEAALVGGCGYIVTGDKVFLRLKKFRRVTVVGPADFLRVLGS